jgi:hypothetical protein
MRSRRARTKIIREREIVCLRRAVDVAEARCRVASDQGGTHMLATHPHIVQLDRLGDEIAPAR